MKQLKKRSINTRLWDDPWVVDQLNALDCYFFLYLLTNNHTTMAGVYEITLRTMAFESKIDKEEIERMLKRLEPKVHYVDNWIVIRNSIKNQNYKSPQVKTNIENDLQNCPKKLLGYINYPSDWIPAVVKKETEQLQIDTDTVSILNADNTPIINSNSNSNFNFNRREEGGNEPSEETEQNSDSPIQGDARTIKKAGIVAFTAVTNELGSKAKPATNAYILQVIGELLKHYDISELVAAAAEVKRDRWVQANRRSPSDKLNYLFFTQTKITNADKKLANSIKRVSDLIVKAQESQEQETTDGSVIHRAFGGYNE